jgi:hypothetical protein
VSLSQGQRLGKQHGGLESVEAEDTWAQGQREA